MDNKSIVNHLKAFSENLRSLMDSRGLNGKTLSVECGLPNATINRYLHVVRTPSIDNIILLANFFDVTVDWLMGLSNDRFDDLTPEVRELIRLYYLATESDREVVNTLLRKYKDK